MKSGRDKRKERLVLKNQIKAFKIDRVHLRKKNEVRNWICSRTGTILVKCPVFRLPLYSNSTIHYMMTEVL